MQFIPPKVIKVRDRYIGTSLPVFVIAEAGVNHNGDIEKAFELIRAAKRSGADCVKFQTFKADRVAMHEAPKAKYQLSSTDPLESQFQMLKGLQLRDSAYGDLMALCEELDIIFSSTPYNEEDLIFLDRLNVPVLKGASMHIAEPRFLQRMAETGRPLIVSTGMARWEEVEEAVHAIRATGNDDFVLLQCTTSYPAPLEDTNLRAMVSMRQRFNCNVGYSDHTQSHTPCIGAVALGACVIEKHLTLDRAMKGPDHSASATPDEFAELTSEIREMGLAMGSPEKEPTIAERDNIPVMRRSIVARQKIDKGGRIDDDDLTCRRPLAGISPREWEGLLGQVALREIPKGEMLDYQNLARFRPMQTEDLHQLETNLRSEGAEYMRYFTAFSSPGDLERQFTRARKDIFFAIETARTLAGFYCLRGFDAGYERPTFGIYVASTFAGRGVGSAALNNALSTCQHLNVRHVMLKVAQNHQRARLVYEAAGFLAAGSCPDTGQTVMFKELP